MLSLLSLQNPICDINDARLLSNLSWPLDLQVTISGQTSNIIHNLIGDDPNLISYTDTWGPGARKRITWSYHAWNCLSNQIDKLLINKLFSENQCLQRWNIRLLSANAMNRKQLHFLKWFIYASLYGQVHRVLVYLWCMVQLLNSIILLLSDNWRIPPAPCEFSMSRELTV